MISVTNSVVYIATYIAGARLWHCIAAMGGVIKMSDTKAGCQQAREINPVKSTIVLVASGTSVPRARRVYDYIDSAAKNRYPNADIRWAFTSRFIRDKLAGQGVVTKSVEEIVNDLRSGGRGQAVFQSVHVVPGLEFREIGKAIAKEPGFALGSALLTTDADIAAAIKAVGKDIRDDSANIIIAHGNACNPEFNEQLVKFARAIESTRDNVFVCTIQGLPGRENLQVARKQLARSGNANFIPLMIVAGDHILNDVVGEGEDSWKNIISASSNTLAGPLGYNDEVLAIYFQHIDEALTRLMK